jgi:hypothetical protein
MVKHDLREMRLTVRADLPRKTDVTLREWADLVRISAPRGTKSARANWLRKTYGLGAAQAEVILDFVEGKDDQPRRHARH